MPFNEKARLDPSQVQDRRGMRTGTKVAVGGGGLSLLVVLFALLMGVNPGDLLNTADSTSLTYDPYIGEISDLAAECQTGADANTRQDCAIVGYVNSIQAYWSDVFADQGIQYIPAQTVLFSGATDAACGYAYGAMGPFYCTIDQKVYLDLSFFDSMQARFGTGGGEFARAYVVSHEYGHHIQDLLGILETTTGYESQGPQSMSVYTELQADCLAGVWISHAVETGYLSQVTDQEITQALEAAAAVGDDRIQRQTQGYVVPETWTHGSSEQRYYALLDGIQTGDPNTCETPGWSE
ncbi:MAG: neutral zinc metallopeptidase [Anaerolineaceae bacterium]|nr:neutral zinc metallopeptidase [Anaerolineaceae bacterium]MBN2678255.1 neutral zinc metallopeptidase [Anaerolineaceae bacterium]